MKKWFRKLRNEDGFTLIEMSIVLVIIALLLLMVVPNIGNVMTSATDKTDDALIKNVEAQKELYKVDKKQTTMPTAKSLEEDGYIAEGQAEAYEAALERNNEAQ